MTKYSDTLRRAPIVAATFGQCYGYRFDGDSVTLQASFQLSHHLAHELRWFLQLQARPAGDSSSEASFTHVVAEAPLPPLTELTGTADEFSLQTPAQPPAGQGEFQLALALISRQDEQPAELHDIALFSRTERFTQPRLVASLACTFGKDDLSFTAGRIENPRDPSNISGTLAMEFWALTAPYDGGSFQGQPLAGIVLGQLNGQEGWDHVEYTLHCAKPSSGQWHVAAMLREWTGSSYTTRDYRNLAEPLVIIPPAITPLSIASKTAPVASAPATVASKPSPLVSEPPKAPALPAGKEAKAKKPQSTAKKTTSKRQKGR